MDIALWKLLLAICAFHLVTTGGQPSVDEHAENQQLKTLLRQSREQNRRLEKQMNRLKLVWAGLEAMCDVLSSASTSESESMVTPGTTISLPETMPLRVLAASSSGNTTGEVTLTVTYTAPRVHSPDWSVSYDKYTPGLLNMIRTGGTTSSLGDGKYTSTITVPFLDVEVIIITLYLHTKYEALGLHFNVHAIVNATEESAPAYTSPIHDMFVRRQDGTDRQLLIDEAQVAPTTGDLNITHIVDGTARAAVAIGAEVSMVGLTTLNGTTEYYKEYDGDAIRLSDKTTTISSEWLISLKEPYVQRGGVLSVFIPVMEDSNPVLKDGIFKSVHIGYNITILPPDSTELVPENTLGIRPWPNTTTVFTANHSLTCIAIGNPQPKLQILRELAD